MSWALVPAPLEVRSLFEQGEQYVPEMLVSAQAMRAGMDLLRPLLEAGECRLADTVVMGTVQGDIHDIGESLVSLMLRGSGFEVIDAELTFPPPSSCRRSKRAVLGSSA